MTKDDITRMAREAGFEGMTDHPALMRFANLVAAAKAEECAKLCDDLDDDLPDGLAGWQFGEAIRARGEQA